MVALYSLVVLVSAFLLFAVQPMVAKMLLPNLGGAPSVWNTAMVFYQGALLLGYAYAHLVARKLSFKAQLIVHAVALLLPFIVLPLGYGNLHPPTTGNPAPWMLMVMATSVGLPFAVLSATSPLLQAWFARVGGRDPYFLYAASNVGSFLGLLAYPLFIEPQLGVDRQSSYWTIGYVVLSSLFLAVIFTASRKSRSEPQVAEAGEAEEIPWKRKARWVFLAFLPSSLFLGVTSYLTTDIAVLPLLWVLPLAIYLLSMVLVFANRPPIPHKLIVFIFPFCLAGLVFLIATKTGQFNLVAFAGHLVFLFVAAMLCHGELAKDRPSSARLTEFFLWMSFGGVLGGMFNALVAPQVFVKVIEYTLVLALLGLALPKRSKDDSALAAAMDFSLPISIAVLVTVLAWGHVTNSLPILEIGVTVGIGVGCLIISLLGKRPLRFALGIAGMLIVGAYAFQSSNREIFAGRSFFGVYKVEESNGWHLLLNGRILHGQQIMKLPAAAEPSSYYHPLGPLKEVLGDWPRDPGAKVAVVGLGIGNVCLWSKPGESWTFFEIDPLVERIARDTRLFTSIENAKAEVDVVIGDARLQLSRTDQKFDIVLIDAFTSDAIPVHLLTLEAVKVYQSRLMPGGILLVHTSNKFLELEPIVGRIAREIGWPAFTCNESEDEPVGEMAPGRTTSAWVVLGSRDVNWKPITASGRWKPQSPGDILWTDSYSSIVPVIRKGAFRLKFR